jgi:hypothetical protein
MGLVTLDQLLDRLARGGGRSSRSILKVRPSGCSESKESMRTTDTLVAWTHAPHARRLRVAWDGDTLMLTLERPRGTAVRGIAYAMSRACLEQYQFGWRAGVAYVLWSMRRELRKPEDA